MADEVVECTNKLAEQTDVNLKMYIKSRMLNVADAHLDDMSHSALLGFATELQLKFNNNVAGGTQNTPHIDGLAKLNAKYICGLNDYFNINNSNYKKGKLNIVLGTISNKAELPQPRSDELVDINKDKNNNNNKIDLSGFGDLSAIADMEVEKINAIAGLARIFQNAPAIGTKDKDGRNKKKRRLNNNNNNNYNTVCINKFIFIIYYFLSISVSFQRAKFPEISRFFEWSFFYFFASLHARLLMAHHTITQPYEFLHLLKCITHHSQRIHQIYPTCTI